MQPINTDSKRLHMDWKQKLKVLDEAYEKGFGIKPTARKYDLYPHQIPRTDQAVDFKATVNMLTRGCG